MDSKNPFLQSVVLVSYVKSDGAYVIEIGSGVSKLIVLHKWIKYPLNINDHIISFLIANERLAEEFGLAGDGMAVTYFGTEDALFLWNWVQNFHCQDCWAVLAIYYVGYWLTFLWFVLLFRHVFAEILLQNYLFNFPKFFEELFNIALVEAKSVGDGDSKDANLFLVVFLQFVYDAIDCSTFINECIFEFLKEIFRTLDWLFWFWGGAVWVGIISSSAGWTFPAHNANINHTFTFLYLLF